MTDLDAQTAARDFERLDRLSFCSIIRVQVPVATGAALELDAD